MWSNPSNPSGYGPVFTCSNDYTDLLHVLCLKLAEILSCTIKTRVDLCTTLVAPVLLHTKWRHTVYTVESSLYLEVICYTTCHIHVHIYVKRRTYKVRVTMLEIVCRIRSRPIYRPDQYCLRYTRKWILSIILGYKKKQCLTWSNLMLTWYPNLPIHTRNGWYSDPASNNR